MLILFQIFVPDKHEGIHSGFSLNCADDIDGVLWNVGGMLVCSGTGMTMERSGIGHLKIVISHL